MIDTAEEMSMYIRADAARHGGLSVPNLLKNPIARFQVLLRLTEFATNRRIFGAGLLRAVFRHRSIRLGFTVPLNVCGPGLSLAHYGSIVIDAEVHIGKNCRIHSGVNIGRHRGGSPRIGDDVYIGPGAKLFGPIEIGDDCQIGANAVVTRSFPKGSRLHGVPAKVH